MLTLSADLFVTHQVLEQSLEQALRGQRQRDSRLGQPPHRPMDVCLPRDVDFSGELNHLAHGVSPERLRRGKKTQGEESVAGWGFV